jgi:hypothetical protein
MPLAVDLSRSSVVAPIFVVLSVAFTWPLAAHLGTRLAADQGDPAFNGWVLAWTAGQLLDALRGNLSALGSYWHGNIFHPEPLTLAYSEHLTAQAVQILPVYAATGNILTAYNLLFISTFALSGWGMYLFVRDLTGRPLAAFLAGVAFAFAPYRLGQFSHLQVLSSGWMPLALLGLRRYVAGGRVRALAGGAAALLLQNLSCGYYLLFFTPFAGAYALYEMAARRRLRDRRTWIGLAGAAAAVALLTLPFVAPYLQLRQIRDLGVRTVDEISMFSADTHALVSIAPNSRLLGEARSGYVAPEGEGFVGFTIAAFAIGATVAGLIAIVRRLPWTTMRDWHVLATALSGLLCLGSAAVVAVMFANGAAVLALGSRQIIYRDAATPLFYFAVSAVVFAALAAAARRRSGGDPPDGFGYFLCAAIAAGLFALGPEIHALGRSLGRGPYALLLEYVPGFDGLRVPARFLMLMACFLAVLAGLGAARLRPLGTLGRAVVMAGVIGILAESWVAPMQTNEPVLPGDGLLVPAPPASGRDTPPMYRLLRDLPGSVVLAELPFGDAAYDTLATFYAGHHRRPLLNGYSGFFPATYHERAAALRDPLADPAHAAETLAAAGATHVLLHEGAFADGRGRLIADWLTSIGAVPVASDGGDRLYALR